MMAVCHAGSITTYRFTEMACARDRHGRLCWLCAIANTAPPPPPVGPAPLRCIHGVSQSAEMYISVDILKTCMYMQNFIYKY